MSEVPVRIDGYSVILIPELMKINQIYEATLDGKKFWYRKINKTEIQVYEVQK